MGLFTIAPAQAGARFRDDYGAATIANTYTTSHCNTVRSVLFNEGLKHVA